MAYKIIPDYSKYVIFDDGRIWSRRKRVFMSQCENFDGYPSSYLTLDSGRRRSIAFHILIARAFISNPKGYKEINHIDGNKRNNHYTNLEWCTRSHNIKHCYKLGLRERFYYKKNTKLSKQIAEEIRSLFNTGSKIKDLSLLYGVTNTHIQYIVNNQSWA